jgi:hypothetical protein
MSTRVTERVDEWTERPFEGGYRGLDELAGEKFSGVVRAGGAELYMTKGTPVGLLAGRIEDFEDATGTAYEAPSPALPLLAVMQDQGQDARAEYYTEDTPLDEIDGRLADGGFTGYVELAENVLSGDYYVVYHQGRSMGVAFVGPEKRVKIDEEAREGATGEVGIYRVHPADIDPIDLPEPEPEPELDEVETAAATAEATAGAADEGSTETDTETAETEETVEATEAAGADTTGVPADEEAEAAAGGTVEDATNERGTARGSEREPATTHTAGGERVGTERATTPADDGTTTDANSTHLETRSIPSLDPGRTETDDREPAVPEQGTDDPLGPAAAGGAETDPGGRGHDRGAAGRREAGAQRESASPRVDEAEPDRPSVDPERVEELEAELAERDVEIEGLEAELDAATERRDELEADLDAVREERDELASEVERLEAELDRLKDEFGAATGREERITPQEALAGTDIFVRYRSKGDATLEKAHEGNVLQEDVVDNLVLEKHTQFDADGVAVGGQSYGEFLEETVEYQFVEWVAEHLLFEIRDTGHRDALKTLYDALPNIDRAELHGTVEMVSIEDGQETKATEQFDIVYRDRMGDPLLVANINDSREAATQSMMERLVTAAERVGSAGEDFAAAFLVTTSFFEPGALETASEATRGGLLSRNKRKSFVNLSRKRGYHLCLVEARSENFTLTVPEL